MSWIVLLTRRCLSPGDVTTCPFPNLLLLQDTEPLCFVLQQEVRDLNVKMTTFLDDKVEIYRDVTKKTTDILKIYTNLSTLSSRMVALEQHAPAITRFEAHEALYSSDRPYFYDTLKYLTTEMVNVSKAGRNTDDSVKIEQLVSRVAALEKPWYNKFTTTEPRASDPARSTPPATNMTALLLRMDEFDS